MDVIWVSLARGPGFEGLKPPSTRLTYLLPMSGQHLGNIGSVHYRHDKNGQKLKTENVDWDVMNQMQRRPKLTCCKIGQGHLKVMVYICIELEPLTLHAKSQNQRTFGCKEQVLPY